MNKTFGLVFGILSLLLGLFFLFVSLTTPNFGFGVVASIFLIVLGLIYIIAYSGIFNKIFNKLPEKIKDKVKNIAGISILVLIIVFFIGVIISIGYSCSSEPKYKYEPTAQEVMEWYDETDDDGNYIHRDEYNKKRSY